jgi:hypothetical protein
MILRTDPRVLMVIGFALMVMGVCLPFSMILNIIPSTLFLGFFSYAISFLGLMLGIIGVVLYFGRFRNRR